MQTTVSALVLIAFLCVSAHQAVAQSAPNPPATGWPRVQAMQTGATVQVKAAGHKTTCAITSVALDSLTCTDSHAAPHTYAVADIQWIKVHHRGRSTLIGAAPGLALTAGGAIAAKTENCTGQFLCGLGAAALTLLGIAVAIIGAIVGYSTDFSASTIYRRP